MCPAGAAKRLLFVCALLALSVVPAGLALGRGAAADPVLGRTALVRLINGTVTLRGPHGHGSRVLVGAVSVRFGSTIDTTAGTVQITTATRHGYQHARFHGGRFLLTQTRSADTRLTLNAPLDCGAHAARVKRHAPLASRSLWGSGHGQFTTIGTYASATVLGTRWRIVDTCTSTQVTVRSGEVRVANLVSHTSSVLHTAQSLLVPGPTDATKLPASQLEAWNTLEVPFASSTQRFSAGLFGLRADGAWNSSAVTAAQLAAPFAAYAPAVERFDAGLRAIPFAGATKTDIDDLLGLDAKFLPILTHMTKSEFISQYDVPYTLITPWPQSLAKQFLSVQASLARDLGAPANELTI